ncbi:hypothetical protein [Mycobacterium marinum]|uniref:hypothetical protein n=1 Tax=Mycobacterium marinum TaxID=1781 RepID=UPI003569740B
MGEAAVPAAGLTAELGAVAGRGTSDPNGGNGPIGPPAADPLVPVVVGGGDAAAGVVTGAGPGDTPPGAVLPAAVEAGGRTGGANGVGAPPAPAPAPKPREKSDAAAGGCAIPAPAAPPLGDGTPCVGKPPPPEPPGIPEDGNFTPPPDPPEGAPPPPNGAAGTPPLGKDGDGEIPEAGPAPPPPAWVSGR